MKHILKMMCLTLCVVNTAWATQESPAPQPGPRPDPLPAAEFHLSSFAGQVVLVDFWASWCGPCRKSLPWLNLMQEKYGKQGLRIVTVNLDKKPGAARKMSRAMVPGIQQFVDPKGVLAARYELKGMPSSYLYDRAGEQLAAHLGFVDREKNKREQEIQAALLRKEP